MRTRGKGEGLIEQNENMRFGWALPNTPFLRYPHLNHWIFRSSLFVLHLNYWIFPSSLFTFHLNSLFTQSPLLYLLLFGNKSYWHGSISFRIISRRTRHKSVV